MSPRLLQTCEMFEPAEKACWEILFREEVGDGEIPADVLEGAMRQTLGQLWALLRVKSLEAWLKQPPPLVASTALPDCALKLLRPYFASGQRTLELIAAEIPDSYPSLSDDLAVARVELLAAFERLAHAQLAAICAGCARRGSCPFSERQVTDRARRKTVKSRRRTRNGSMSVAG